jgi:hypothetical protein
MKLIGKISNCRHTQGLGLIRLKIIMQQVVKLFQRAWAKASG